MICIFVWTASIIFFKKSSSEHRTQTNRKQKSWNYVGQKSLNWRHYLFMATTSLISESFKLATNGCFLFLVQWQSERILWLRSKFQPLDWRFLTLKLWKKLPNELKIWKMIWLETSELTVTLWRLIVYSFVRSPTKLMQ